MMAIKFHETGSTVRQVASRRCRIEMHLCRHVPAFQPLLEQCAEPAAALDRATLDPDLFAALASEPALGQPFTVPVARCLAVPADRISARLRVPAVTFGLRAGPIPDSFVVKTFG